MKKSLFAVVLLLSAGRRRLLAAELRYHLYHSTARRQSAATPRPPDRLQPKGGPGTRGPLPVEVAVAAQTTLSDDVTAIGTLLAEESVDISAETGGRVADILFKDGETVAAGAALFNLDADLLKAELADAEAEAWRLR